MTAIPYKHYLVGLLLVILTYNYVDRLVLGLVLQDIKADFQVTDTELGLLTGVAFAVFYSLMGIPIARWADRGNRVTIISLAIAVWSVMVALCGITTTFLQLMLVRVGIGVGEAGCVPPAHSLIADYFSRAERPKAFAIYMLGGSLSPLIGYFAAGWLNQIVGWRETFIVLGLPGLLLAALARSTLKEPRRFGSSSVETPSQVEPANAAGPNPAFASVEGVPSLRRTCITLWRNVTFRHLVLSLAVGAFFAAGILQWQPAFFVRSYGLRTGQLGTWFAAIYGMGGMLGTYLGGALATRYAPHDEPLQLRAIAAANVAFAVISALVYLSPNRHAAFACLALASVGGASVNGPLFATIQSLVEPRMRAIAIALVLLCANLIGGGLGPLAAGVLSDALRPALGDDSLRYALLVLCPGYAWAGWHLWRASRSVASDLRSIDRAPMHPNLIMREATRQ